MPIDFVGNFLPSLSIRDKQEREETRFCLNGLWSFLHFSDRYAI
jgi:hypothetical protein